MSLSLPRSRRLFWLAAFGFLPASVLLLAIVNAVYAVPIGGVSIDATASATPADGSVTINVALAGPLAGTVTAQYTTVDGTATSPADYTAQSGTVTFAPGVPDQQITIAITNPGTGAPNKSFTVVLSNVTSPGWLVNAICTVTITETPPPTVQFSSATFSVNETAGSETITVVLSGPPSAVATVNYATSDGTGKHPAIAGKNYTATSGTLTFNPSDPSPANTTQSFTVPITNSGKPGPNRSLNLTLSSPSGATLGTPSRAVLTILDTNQPKTPEFEEMLAKVSSTPPLTPRNDEFLKATGGEKVVNDWPLAGDPPATDLIFSSPFSIEETSDGSLRFKDASFKTPNALVLLKDSGDVKLTVKVKELGDKKLAFQVVRAPDDSAKVGAAEFVPTVVATGAKTARLKTDRTGSFQVVAFVDKGGGGQWKKGDKGVALYYVVVLADPFDAIAGDGCEAHPENLKTAFRPEKNPSGFAIESGEFDVTAPKKAAVSFEGKVKLIGGGPDGKRGVDRVFFGWANNLTASTEIAHYGPTKISPKPTVEGLYVSNDQDAQEPALFLQGEKPSPMPAGGIPLPVLDTGRVAPAGGKFDGGIDVVLTTAPNNGIGDVDAGQFPPGQVRSVKAVDSPRAIFPAWHPLDSNSALLKVTYQQQYTSQMIGWTNTGGGAAPTPNSGGTVGYRTFSTLRFVTWKMGGAWDLTPPPQGKKSPWTFTPAKGKNAPAISMAAKTAVADRGFYYPLKKTEEAAFEVRPPRALPAHVLYAKTK